MAVLVGGESYALSSSSHPQKKKKTIVYVKLTDSSLRVLEEYLSSTSGSHQNHKGLLKPTIEFNQNSGKICIPRNSNGDKSTYRFNVSSLNESTGPQGSFELLQSQKPSSTLESIGSLQEKITVNASDDAYKRFGQKMVEVKKENEKRTTQFLDNNKVSNKISSKLRHKNSSSSSSNIPSSSISSSSSHSLSRHLNNSSSSGSSGSNHFSSSLNPRIVPSSSSSSGRSASPSLAPHHPIMDRKQQGAGSSFTKSLNPPGHPNISRRSLKERIIHHLAVGPLKKLELNSRLYRDGLRDKDKKLVGTVIKQVSLMKDNTYSLLRHLWNDVSEDWPYYTEQERATFRRRKPQNLTPPVSDGGSSTCSSGHSPSSTNPASPARSSPPHPPKRSFPYESDPSASKKKRVSNYQRPNHPPLQPTSTPAATAKQIHHHHNSTNHPPPPTMEDPSTKTSNWLNSRPKPVQSSSRGAPTQQQKRQPEAPPAAAVSSSSSTSSVNSSAAFPRDFLSAFTKIKNKDQRAYYKVEFNNNYIRYRELHSQLEKVSKRFAQSEEQLRSIIQTDERSMAKKKIKEIEQDYRHTNNDPAYVRTREEFKYLHEKLAHIKNLVHDYDMDHLSKGGSSSNAPGSSSSSSPVLSAMS
eukprot:TRINITY_DN323_c0_g2_i1.p1 TRINITY_DN323_c0_g2~~TRINITY_DN323_c0_g2_i1.p1  ORF type:complete len:637 (-),score=225.37 TRINITY_DN323_c0_g2_i1:2368-4278(-)